MVTLPRLPPTHLEYSFVDDLAFAVRGLDVRGLAVKNVSSIVVVGGVHLSYSIRFGGSGKLNLPYCTLSGRLWEAHLYVFYVPGRLQGGPISN